MTEPTTQFELSDVEVDTLGLVSRGANREEFFMLKSDSAATAEDALGDRLWHKFVAVLRKALDAEQVVSTDPEPGVNQPADTVSPDAIEDTVANRQAEADAAVKSDKADAEPVTESVVAPVAETSMADALVTTTTSKILSQSDSMKESDMSEDTDTTGVPSAGEFVSKTDHEALVQELTVLKAELAQAREDKERAVYLAKAQDYPTVPVPTRELADHLYWLAKTDATRYEWFEGILKALDNQMRDSHLFVEKGHNVPIENDAVAAALKSADVKAALLSLDRKQAESYLRGVRKMAQEG